jgi:thioredoxin-dependent adenylylsulfate APS reductase
VSTLEEGTLRPPASADVLSVAAAELAGAGPEEILSWAFERFDRVALVSSFQAESIVLIDIASRLRPGVEVITLDTGRLPEETHALIDAVGKRFPIRLRVITPDPGEIESMVAAHGVSLFRRSPELRHLCCAVRKTRPLIAGLRDYDAWVTGLRRGQSASRQTTPVVARDDLHGGIAKIAPLAAWSHDDVWRHLRSRDLPVHELYARGYTSIGCAPCTRATRPGEDERAGRWWWEDGSLKECGLHVDRVSSPPREATG